LRKIDLETKTTHSKRNITWIYFDQNHRNINGNYSKNRLGLRIEYNSSKISRKVCKEVIDKKIPYLNELFFYIRMRGLEVKKSKKTEKRKNKEF